VSVEAQVCAGVEGFFLRDPEESGRGELHTVMGNTWILEMTTRLSATKHVPQGRTVQAAVYLILAASLEIPWALSRIVRLQPS